ncbi:MAG TPA: TIGR03667 family PPOX class F420-dependent oxidoreductase [Ktedonobacteraceae bacterium]|nr:TIGR03667 family PPOX class F420-dependent oxidoreductase [Ktedonobacteraceae bacterium]
MLDLTQKKDVHIDERLRSNIIVWFTTVRTDGRPHSVAVWFLWDGSQILIFSQPNKQKLRNLQHNPHVVLALDDTKNGGDVIVIEGKVELIDNAEVNTTLPAYAEKYTPLLNEMGWSPESMAADYSQAIRVTPTKFMTVS